MNEIEALNAMLGITVTPGTTADGAHVWTFTAADFTYAALEAKRRALDFCPRPRTLMRRKIARALRGVV